MATKTEICNLAISHLGSVKRIANVETEKSTEASVCNIFYDQVLEQVLRDADWSFSTKFVSLGLISTDPTAEWGYAYQYPSDCVRFRRILSGDRKDTFQSRVPLKIVYDGESGKLVYTDKQDAVAEYSLRIKNPLVYPGDFVMAFSFLLAVYIGPSITGEDPFKMGDRAMKMYVSLISQAQAANFNEQYAGEEPDGEFIRARD